MEERRRSEAVNRSAKLALDVLLGAVVPILVLSKPSGAPCYAAPSPPLLRHL